MEGERGKLEEIEERSLRWVLGVEWRTLRCLIREELQRDRLEGRVRKRAWNFEDRLKEGKGSILARKCLSEMQERWSKGKVRAGWKKERKEFLRYRDRRSKKEKRQKLAD